MALAGAFVGLQLCACVCLAASLGFYEPPPFEKYAWAAMFPPMLYAGGLAAWRLRALPGKPFRYLLAQDWRRPLSFALAMALTWLQFVSLTWSKAMIPLATPMWADVPLANLESALFGQDAWRLLPGPSAWIVWPYAMWPFVIGFGFMLAFFKRREDAAMLAFFLTVGLLGTFGQYLLPSGGPVFYERLGFGDRFAAMPVHPAVERATSYLWAAYHGQYMRFATGISAFPSIHVATSAWLALTFRHWIAWAYLGVIFFGSIILGWHYALDGAAGALGAVLCYRLARIALVVRIPRLRSANATARQ